LRYALEAALLGLRLQSSLESDTTCPDEHPRKHTVAISSETLKAERDALKDTLREVEADQRRLEADLKAVRQRELRTKREIEALTTLIELSDDESNRSAGS